MGPAEPPGLKVENPKNRGSPCLEEKARILRESWEASSRNQPPRASAGGQTLPGFQPSCSAASRWHDLRKRSSPKQGWGSRSLAFRHQHILILEKDLNESFSGSLPGSEHFG